MRKKKVGIFSKLTENPEARNWYRRATHLILFKFGKFGVTKSESEECPDRVWNRLRRINGGKKKRRKKKIMYKDEINGQMQHGWEGVKALFAETFSLSIASKFLSSLDPIMGCRRPIFCLVLSSKNAQTNFHSRVFLFLFYIKEIFCKFFWKVYFYRPTNLYLYIYIYIYYNPINWKGKKF